MSGYNATASKAWYSRNPEQRLLEHAKYRAKKFGLEFNINRDDLRIPDCCPFLGIPLIAGNGERSDNSPSVDRLDSSKGYIKGNVVVCSWRANRLKQDATLEQMVRIATSVAMMIKER